MSKPTIVTIVGTRPEIIRLSRVIARLDTLANHFLIHTGQNSDPNLSDIFFSDLGIRKPDFYLEINTETLGTALGETLIKSEKILKNLKPNAVLVLGDTNSSISAVIAKRMNIPVYHMEAGNRSFDSNVPEEVNRKLVDHVSDFNLAYTEHARRNLLAEGIQPRHILVTGSPIREIANFYRSKIEESKILESLSLKPKEYFLVSAHRQENIDSEIRLKELVNTLREIQEKYRVPVLVSTHPRIKNKITEYKVDLPAGVIFHEPFGFLDYNKLQLNAKCVVSDSGTISEESIILGFPAITIRDSIERPEALDAGGIIMTGLTSEEVLSGINFAINEFKDAKIEPPFEYMVDDFSRRVIGFVLSTMSRHHEWFGIRKQ